MTDHANELRRHARKIGHPAGDAPAVMAAAADWIEHLQAKSEAAEKERDDLRAKLDELRDRLEAMEQPGANRVPARPASSEFAG